ncbi:MAG: endonuclease/exonuclease/phosphatase family protein [Gemmatimonadales bacterium]
MVTIVDPVAEIEGAQAGSTLPSQLAKQYTLDVAVHRARCQGNRFVDLRLEVRGEAENGVGQTRLLPPAIVTSFGPDMLKVGTFNLHQPGHYDDSTHARWGLQLGMHADVLLLTEVRDRHVAEVVAAAAGMQYFVLLREAYPDVAILSRAPLRNVRRQVIDPPGTLTSNDSHILSAETDIGGHPHVVVATHWGIKGANDVPYGGHEASPERLQAAQAILTLLPPPPGIAIVGGDLNALSGYGPQNHDADLNTPDWIGGTPEVALLYTRLKDPFVVLQVPNDQHCSDGRGDYVLFDGPLAPLRYEACWPDDEPSDHPFVLVTLVPE